MAETGSAESTPKATVIVAPSAPTLAVPMGKPVPRGALVVRGLNLRRDGLGAEPGVQISHLDPSRSADLERLEPSAADLREDCAEANLRSVSDVLRCYGNRCHGSALPCVKMRQH